MGGDLLPLPPPFPFSGTGDLKGLSRCVRRRILCKAGWQGWANDGVAALNMLAGVAGSSSQVPSLAQRDALARITKAYASLAKPPDMSPAGAFKELCGSRVPYLSESAGPEPYVRDLLSLPDGGGLMEISGDSFPSEHLELLDRASTRMLRTAVDAEAELQAAGIKSPYIDANLRNPRTYGRFLDDLLERGLITLVPETKSYLGMFCVKKKSGKLRLVLDTRVSNCYFKPPPGVRLPTAAALSSMECEANQEVYFSGGDIDNAFYRVRAPGCALPFFTLPRVKVKYLSNPVVDGRRPSQETWVTPQLLVLPMGWSWSLWFCQTMHEFLFERHGIPSCMQIQDRRACPPLKGSDVAGAVYVDNFLLASHDPRQLGVVQSKHTACMNQLGLRIHEIAEPSTSITFAGLEFDGSAHTIRVSTSRVWKLRLGIDHLLSCFRVHGKSLEIVMGHLTWAALSRREFLSIFNSVYKFIGEHQDCSGALWGSVREELFLARSLLPLLFSEFDLPWNPTLTCTDSCETGFGVCETHCGAQAARDIGRTSEKWRYLFEDSVSARAHALEPLLARAAPARDFPESLESDLSPPGLVRPGCLEADVDSFPEVDASLVRSAAWRVVQSREWAYREDILRTEGRALVWAVRRLVRSRRNHLTRIVCLVDNLSLALAVGKGRSGGEQLRPVCRHLCALSLAAGVRLHCRWIPSELNPADEPSRRRCHGKVGAKFPSPPCEKVDFEVHEEGPPTDSHDDQARPSAVEPCRARASAPGVLNMRTAVGSRFFGGAAPAASCGTDVGGEPRRRAAQVSIASEDTTAVRPSRAEYKEAARVPTTVEDTAAVRPSQAEAEDVEYFSARSGGDSEVSCDSGEEDGSFCQCGGRVQDGAIRPSQADRADHQRNTLVVRADRPPGQRAGGLPPPCPGLPGLDGRAWPCPGDGSGIASAFVGVPRPLVLGRGRGPRREQNRCCGATFGARGGVRHCNDAPRLEGPPGLEQTVPRWHARSATVGGSSCRRGLASPPERACRCIGVLGPGALLLATRRADQLAYCRAPRAPSRCSRRQPMVPPVALGGAQPKWQQDQRARRVALVEQCGLRVDEPRVADLEGVEVRGRDAVAFRRLAVCSSDRPGRQRDQPAGLRPVQPPPCGGVPRLASAGALHRGGEDAGQVAERLVLAQVRETGQAATRSCAPVTQHGGLRAGDRAGVAPDLPRDATRATAAAGRAAIDVVAPLRKLLRSALARSRRNGQCQIVLELFSGSGRFGQQAHNAGWGVVALDIAHGPFGDLLNPKVSRLVRSWITSGIVRVLWLGTPCSSWSRARHDIDGGGPRSRQHIWGRPGLPPAEQVRVDLGNATARLSGRFISDAHRAGVATVLENPRSSMLWMCPPISRLLKVGNLVSTDFCQFGAAWRKRTGLASWSACDLSPAVRLCCGRNFLCSRTHKPHMILKGRAPSGASWTKIAEPYPVQFARAAWTALDRAADHNALTRRFQIAGASHKTLKKGYGVGGGVQSHAGEALAIPLVHPKGGSPAQLPDTTG